MNKTNNSAHSVTTGAGESRKFAGDIIWFSVAQLFISMILGIITLPALTKFYSSEIYGIWIQLNVTIELLNPVLSLQLGLAVVKYLAGVEDAALKRRMLGSMLTAILIFTGTVAVGGLLFSREISALLFASQEYTNYVRYLCALMLFNTLFNFFIAYLRVLGKIKEISIVQVISTTLKMVAIVGLANSGMGLDLIVLAMVILQVVFAMVVLGMIIRDTGWPQLNFGGLRTFLAFSLPQIPCVALIWVISYTDRYFITHFLGLAENGIYSSSNIIAGLISLFYTPVSFVLFPLVSRLWAQDRKGDVRSYFEHSLRLFLTLALPAVVGIAVLSQPLLQLLTTSEFLAGEGLVLLLAFGSVFLGVYQINSNLILLGKQARNLPLLTGLGSLASVIMNLILIPRIGISGAALANCSAYAVLAVVTTIWAWKTLSFRFNLMYLGKVAAASAAVWLGLSFWPISGITGLVLGISTGSAIYVIALLLLRAFSEQDKQLVRGLLGNFIPSLLKRGPKRL